MKTVSNNLDMEKKEIEIQVEATLDRLENIKTAPNPPFLYEKITERLKERQRIEKLRPALAIRFAVACAIFISINILTYSHMGKNEKVLNKVALEKFALGYFSSDVFNY